MQSTNLQLSGNSFLSCHTQEATLAPCRESCKQAELKTVAIISHLALTSVRLPAAFCIIYIVNSLTCSCRAPFPLLPSVHPAFPCAPVMASAIKAS